jgi:NAD(P)-dependent dehydrogenase (short-subunit alcohol dehydrogenase family)
MGERLKEKATIVTGAGSVGPGWGNGKATAVLFAGEGAKVFAIDINLDAVEETKGTIDQGGGECTVHKADVSRSDEVKAMARLGPCLVQLFGQAESLMTITYLPHRDHVQEGTPEQMKRLASAGFPRTDVEVKIFDPEDKELPPARWGRLSRVLIWS